jgi:hypothetical protein
MDAYFKSESISTLCVYSWAVILVCMLAAIPASAADSSNVTQVDWDTRTASCPAKVTQSTNVTIRVTNINDLLVDFDHGDTAQYQLRAKGTPMSAVPPENPFLPQAGEQTAAQCDSRTLEGTLRTIRSSVSSNQLIAPPSPGGRYISWRETYNAAVGVNGVSDIERAITLAGAGDASCKTFVDTHDADPVVQWVKRVYAASGAASSGAPAHSIDFNVNLEPNQNYEFKLQEYWKGKVIDGGTVRWSCGENDIVSLSAGPLITTLPYRTYTQQQVPTATGTQNQLVVNGSTNVNVVGAALINIFPPLPRSPGWTTGFAFSVGPVYTLGDAPGVSKLGLFVGGSVHLYRSFFLTPGIHIGQFADYPAGFHEGSVIPSGFGSLTPVTRNTAHFAIGITFKTVSFKKSSQSTGAASNAGANAPAQTKQPASGNQKKVQQGSAGGGTGAGSNPPAQPVPANQNAPAQPVPQPVSPSPGSGNSNPPQR